MTKLHHKTIWITGASSGIGEALAYQCTAQETKLILSARRETELQRVAQHCSGEVQILPLDLTNSETLPEKAEKALSFYGGIDILINGSGISQRGTALETPISVVREIMEVNFFGAIALTQAVLPFMQQKQSGHIVIISSVVGKFGTPLRSTYSASKHALQGYFDCLRAEMSKDNLQVTLVCPGYVNTPISFSALTPTGEKFNKMSINQAKGISPEECATKIIKAIEKNQHEVYIGKSEVLAVYLKRFFPRVFAQIVPYFNPK